MKGINVDLTTVGEGRYVCEECQSDKFVLQFVYPHIGLYCSKCGSWKAWLPQKLFKK